MYRFMPWDKDTLSRGPLCITDTDDDTDEIDTGGDADDTTEDLADEENETALASQDDDADLPDDDIVEKKYGGDKTKAREGYRELRSHASKLEAKNKELEERMAAVERGQQASRQQETIHQELPEVEMARQLAEDVEQEISRLPEGKRNLKATTEAITRRVLSAVRREAATQSQQAVAQSEGREIAERNAAKALEARGLEPGKYMRFFQDEVNKQMQADPAWFQRTGHQEQFDELASRTETYLRSIGIASKAAVTQANRDRLKEADATVAGGSRSRTRQTTDTQDDDGEDESMTAAMRRNRQALVNRGRRLFQQAAH
jgi:hypothetical protein